MSDRSRLAGHGDLSSAVFVGGRWDWMRLSSFQLLIALMAILAGVVFFLDPSSRGRSAIGRELEGAWDQAWSIGYILSGVLNVVGIVRIDRRLECAGLAFLAGAVTIAAIATFRVAGAVAVIPVLTYVATVTACGVRAHWLLRRAR